MVTDFDGGPATGDGSSLAAAPGIADALRDLVRLRARAERLTALADGAHRRGATGL